MQEFWLKRGNQDFPPDREDQQEVGIQFGFNLKESWLFLNQTEIYLLNNTFNPNIFLRRIVLCF
jgi:hypothetical protein